MHGIVTLRGLVLAAAILLVCAHSTACLAQDAKAEDVQKEATVVTLPNAKELEGQFTLHPGPKPLRTDFPDQASWAKAHDRWQERGRELEAGAQIAIPDGHSLAFKGHTRITDAGLVHLKGLAALQSLDLHGCYEITEEGLAHFKDLTALQSLSLTGCDQITDAGLAHLKGLTALLYLGLRGCDKVTDAGLAHLKGLTALQNLDLANCNQITDAGLAHLKNLSALQYLDLRDCDKITDAGFAALRESLPKMNVHR